MSKAYTLVLFHPVVVLHPVTIQREDRVHCSMKRVFIMTVIKITNFHLLFVVLLVVFYPPFLALPTLPSIGGLFAILVP